MNSKEFEAVLKLPGPKRYEYFIKKVVDSEKVWGLYNDGWAMSQDNEGGILIPFWPREEFAQFCAKDDWENYLPKSINLYDYLDKWLPGIKKDGYKPSIFSNNQETVVVDIETLFNDLKRELDNY